MIQATAPNRILRRILLYLLFSGRLWQIISEVDMTVVICEPNNFG